MNQDDRTVRVLVRQYHPSGTTVRVRVASVLCTSTYSSESGGPVDSRGRGSSGGQRSSAVEGLIAACGGTAARGEAPIPHLRAGASPTGSCAAALSACGEPCAAVCAQPPVRAEVTGDAVRGGTSARGGFGLRALSAQTRHGGGVGTHPLPRRSVATGWSGTTRCVSRFLP